MEATSVSPFAAWESFYVIIGSSAAALTGLQFVVVVLGAEMRALRDELATRAFGSPTVVHFCMALLTSAVLSAPWHSVLGAGIALAMCGMGGGLYVARISWHARRQSSYRPELSDWIWYFTLPFLVYVALAVAGLGMTYDPPVCLFVIGGVVLGLVLIGIHNAWDTVTYIAGEPQRTAQKTADGAADNTVQERE